MRTIEEIESVRESADPEVGGANFLLSAIYSLKRQRRELQAEVQALRERVRRLEAQNAAFLNLSADRLLKTQG